MSLYTPMPLELVLDGWSRGAAGPFVDITVRGITMRVIPVSPGAGRIERLIHAPLECYLQPEFQPGQIIFYAEDAAKASEAAPGSAIGGTSPASVPGAVIWTIAEPPALLPGAGSCFAVIP